MMLRYIMISKVSSEKLASRPATAIDENDAMAPVIHRAALRVLVGSLKKLAFRGLI
jgi:hypothetical protein